MLAAGCDCNGGAGNPDAQCIDFDDDKYCQDVDCNDMSPSINPGQIESPARGNCDNNADDDCDMKTDAEDDSCTPDVSGGKMYTLNGATWIEQSLEEALGAMRPSELISSMWTFCNAPAGPHILCVGTMTGQHCANYDLTGTIDSESWQNGTWTDYASLVSDFKTPTFAVATAPDFLAYPSRVLLSANADWWSFNYVANPPADMGLSLFQAPGSDGRKDHDSEWDDARTAGQMPPTGAISVAGDWVEEFADKAFWFLLENNGTLYQFTFEGAGTWQRVTDPDISSLFTKYPATRSRITALERDCGGRLRVITYDLT